MSTDYPNREVWLAKRSTPRKLRRERMVFLSKPVGMAKDEKGRMRVVVGPGRAYNVGNNAQKRKQRAA